MHNMYNNYLAQLTLFHLQKLVVINIFNVEAYEAAIWTFCNKFEWLFLVDPVTS